MREILMASGLIQACACPKARCTGWLRMGQKLAICNGRLWFHVERTGTNHGILTCSYQGIFFYP